MNLLVPSMVLNLVINNSCLHSTVTTSTSTPYSLGYKYSFEIIYSKVNLPTKAFTKNGGGVLETM